MTNKTDDDTQAPEDVVKALIGVAAKGKAAAVKEMSDWLINRLGGKRTRNPPSRLRCLGLVSNRLPVLLQRRSPRA